MCITETLHFHGIQSTLTSSGIRTILLNRPDRNNALTIQMFEDITNILNDAAKDGDKTKIVYITGAGEKYFSSGNDLLNYFPKGDYDPVALLENATNTVEGFFKAGGNALSRGAQRVPASGYGFLADEAAKRAR